MRIGSLCSGIGGLELGLERAGLGTTAWQCEYDPHASEVLARHWPGVPNHGDVKLTDWTQVEPVDVICAGYPCQPFSTAGRRQGTEDERHLWPAVRDAVGVLGPRLVVLENVRGHLSLGFPEVLGDLADLGFDAGWCLLRASDVGAPHQRARLFVAAYARGPGAGRDSGGLAGTSGAEGFGPVDSGAPGLYRPASPDAQDERGERDGRPRDGRTGSENASRPAPAYADIAVDGQSHPQGRQPHPRRGDHGHPGEGSTETRSGGETDTGSALADSESGNGSECDGEPFAGWVPERQPRVGAGGRVLDWGPYRPAIERWEAIHGPAPAPTTDGRLSPDFVCWMQGFPPGWVDGLTRTAALRCLGNAVVPQVAERFGRMVLSKTMAVAA